MATRDLTTRFLRQRSSAVARPRQATADGLLGSGAAGAGGQWNTGAIAGMQPQYVDLMDEINSDVTTIKGKSALGLVTRACVNFRATSACGIFCRVPSSFRAKHEKPICSRPTFKPTQCTAQSAIRRGAGASLLAAC